MSAAVKSQKLPPTDTRGEMAKACLLLTRFRRELQIKSGLDARWQRWVAESLLESCPLTEKCEANG